MTRLLQDITARKLYELPDYSGTDPQRDILLVELLDRECVCREQCRHPNVQLGQPHAGNLMKIETAVWEKRRDIVMKEIWSAFPDMSEDEVLSSARNTYREDATTCFNRHQRPSEGCIDYKDDSKRIGSPTQHPWLAENAPVFLCDFCPVKSWVQAQVFHQRGYYKE